MVNRLKKILQFYNLSPSTFADIMNIQRSSISHLFSGRNKPSLDFILRLMEKYPDIDIYWFLNGNGEMLKDKKKEVNLFEQKEAFVKTDTDIIKAEPKQTKEQNSNVDIFNNNKDVEKIVVFYKNKTFDIYNPN